MISTCEHDAHPQRTARLLPDIGWGFIVAWGLATVFTPIFTSGQINMGTFWFTSMIGAPVGLLALFFMPQLLATKHLREIAVFLAVASMTLGIVLLEIPAPVDDESLLQGVAGIISSFGTAIFTVLWGRHYSQLDPARIEKMATSSLIVSFVCYALILVVPNIFSIVLICCLPFFSAACLLFTDNASSSEQGKSSKESSINDSVSSFGNLSVPSFIRFGLGVIGATTVVSLFWAFINQGLIPTPDGSLTISLLSGLLAAVLIEIYLVRFSRSLNLGTLYRWILPLIAIGCSLLLIPSPTALVMSCCFINAAQALLNLTTFVYFAELSQHANASAIRVFALGRSFLEGGFLVGMLLNPIACILKNFVGSYQGVLFIALTIFIILVMMSIANQDRLTLTLENEDTSRSQTHGSIANNIKLGETAHSSEHPNSITSDTEKTVLSTEQQDKPHATISFEMACEQVADSFGLTKREREILPYLAQGYSLPYIRNELYISQSTIDTHVRHIYKKMDLHSKEELITYVRSHIERGSI